MARSTSGKAKAFFRTTPSGAFDQYLQDIQKLPLIKDPAEERRLARRVQRGDEKAAERLVTANLRFVISYVKKYQGHGLDLSELVAIGNEGLLKAVKKFDPDQGVKFISYAVWWVRQAVLKALAEQTRSVRIPLNQNSQLIRMSRTETYLSQELGREPTDNEIAKALEEAWNGDPVSAFGSVLAFTRPVDAASAEYLVSGNRFVEAIVAPSFADIFYSNCTKIGLLPVPLAEADVRRVMDAGEAEVDLEAQLVRFDGGEASFDIDPDIRHRLLNGLDDISVTLQQEAEIAAYERERERVGPVTTSL